MLVTARGTIWHVQTEDQCVDVHMYSIQGPLNELWPIQEGIARFDCIQSQV